MPMICTICKSEKVNEVNRLIGQFVPFRNIAKQVYGKPNRFSSIYRHATNCLKFDVQKAIDENQLESKVDAYKEFQRSLEFAKDVRKQAKEYLDTHPEDFTGAIRACNDAIKTADSTIDRFAKMEGLYTDNKENPANRTPSEIYSSIVQDMITTTEQRLGRKLNDKEKDEIKQTAKQTVEFKEGKTIDIEGMQ